MIGVARAYRGFLLAGFAAVLLSAWVLAFGTPAAAFAAPGAVYSCTVHPVYQHPVTGAVEDAGGSSGRATGQAMVESAVGSAGMMEVTDAGECFLTMRLSLVDLTSNHVFQVQDWGGSGWSTPAMGVTGTGTDASGTTNDVCVQLPSQRGIVRVSMLVESMGRDVVFYVYADGLREPAPAGFAATIVTEPSAGGAVPVLEEPEPEEAAVAAAAVPADDAASSADDLIAEAGAATAQGLSLSTASAEAPAAGLPTLDARGAAIVAAAVLVAFAVVGACAFRRTRGCRSGIDPDDYSGEYLHG